MDCQTDPVLNPDGRFVAFRCGECGAADEQDRFGKMGICVGNVAAGTAEVVLQGNDAPPGYDLQSVSWAGFGPPAFEADSGLVFASSWPAALAPYGDQTSLWRLEPATADAAPAPVAPDTFVAGKSWGDFSVCVLPDGDLVSASYDQHPEIEGLGGVEGLWLNPADGSARAPLLDSNSGAAGLDARRVVCAPAR